MALRLADSATKQAPSLPADRVDTIDLSLTLAKANANHNIPLIKLPAELKNQILSMAMPTATTVLLRAEIHSDHTGRKAFKFHPAVPSVLAACHQLRDDGLKLYYASNTFFLTDNMLQSKVIEYFEKARGEGADSIRKANVKHQFFAMKPYGADRHPTRAFSPTPPAFRGFLEMYSVSFVVAETERGELTLSSFQAGERHPKSDSGHALSVKETSPGLCCCSLEGLIAEEGTKNVVGLPRFYAELFNEYDVKVQKKLLGDHQHIAGRICRSCKKDKSI